MNVLYICSFTYLYVYERHCKKNQCEKFHHREQVQSKIIFNLTSVEVTF